ncbi:MAG: hypothetical protein NPIRA04_04050 [Nitrospirales bacterium]|nr:MAG: hypothetical protein NPIRA04_04050 [Nitrospirales bacterium]
MRFLLLFLLVCFVSSMTGCQSLSVKSSGEEFTAGTDDSSSTDPTNSLNTLTVTEEPIEEETIITFTPTRDIETRPEPYREKPDFWKELLSKFASTDPNNNGNQPLAENSAIQVGPAASHMWPGGKYVPLVLFDYDQYFLTEHGQETLNDASDWLRKDPKNSLLIEGHADLRGTHAYNMTLGHKRATSVKEYLSDLGIEQSRIETLSYGEAKPICDHDNTLCHTINRRAFVVIQEPRQKIATTSTSGTSYAFSSIETY